MSAYDISYTINLGINSILNNILKEYHVKKFPNGPCVETPMSFIDIGPNDVCNHFTSLFRPIFQESIDEVLDIQIAVFINTNDELNQQFFKNN